ncbi:uncharacterized protein LOC123013236 [Tribolium madens]|uniref:uncharacterized protein LOC123013236 n=1 Tax=Tribolium madens TaxID=41895 RepID=UPI001CF7629E|nr:uncharacterized protein LOC123013236 [Tribolium madens]XP_044267588.1 uncharacterized protein LOC123013236 [Tribolium madens]
MDFTMVNSSSFGSEQDGNTKASCMQAHGLHTNNQSTSPLTASGATQSKNDFSETIHGRQLCKSFAVEPVPSQTEFETPKAAVTDKTEANESRKSLFCSVPLEKVQQILPKYTCSKIKTTRKVLCLFCERTFVNVNLRQKHVERCHSFKQLRRVSLRKHQNFLTNTLCNYCDKFGSTEHTLKDLFKHLIESHSNKYFGCLLCEERFLNSAHLLEHNISHHNFVPKNEETSDLNDSVSHLNETSAKPLEVQEEVPVKITRRKQRTRNENKVTVVGSNEDTNKSTNVKNLRSRKLTVKSSRMIIKRSKRLQAKLGETKKKRKDVIEKKKNDRQEQISEKSAKALPSHVNPYPEFDHFYQVKKITDHSIDNLKISSLTFDDVFDKAFFNRIKCNIQENLLHHIDGKLFKNEESESRISNFEKISNIPQEVHNVNSESYGCELSINAIAPTTTLLSNQFGDDPESQIEYGSKPSKKKAQVKKDEVHYKYFTRRKYQASILEHKENRDLSKLDMWTQYVIKNRQQKILNDKKSPKEILDYFTGEEYKSIMRREELNRILDRRGPFEDLREEASKKAALDKLNDQTGVTEDDNFAEIGEILNDILNKVFELAKESYPSVQTRTPNNTTDLDQNIPEIPSYLNLRPRVGSLSDNEIDKSDKIALICSSQETENFELPSNTVRGKNEKVELTGEWARSRIYVCAACGLKLQNIKQFLEHKSASHQYIWMQHYEFVGNQSELYRHLSIPVLGKVGVLENLVQCKVWKRSDARLCTKCGKQCNSLGELHRHILECGGDWTWMLARKKCKYRPFGAKSRRKRRGLIKRIYTQKTEPSEKKIYKKSFDIPRQKPSDADTIKRMLANLPPKRATRKVMCLKDGFNTSTRTKHIKPTNQTKFKCGKLIHGKTKELKTTKPDYEKTNKNQPNHHRRSLRSLNKVLTSRILETNSSLIARRKYNRTINSEKKKCSPQTNKTNDETSQQSEEQLPKKITKTNLNIEEKGPKEETKLKRSSPRIEKRVQFNGDKMNIKRFFPVKKKKNGENPAIKRKSLDESPLKNQVKKKPKADVNETGGTKLNLRKRKVSEKNNEKTTVKTRRLRNNASEFDTPDESSTQHENNTQRDMKHFFERIVPKKIPDPPEEAKDELPQIEQTENNATLETTILNAEKDEKLNEVQSDVPVVTQTINPPKSKRKLRKPIRGLNDCIAMLTSKLGQNFENLATKDLFNESQESKLGDSTTEKSEFILKVPLFNEHFDLHSSRKEYECLDKEVPLGELSSNENVKSTKDEVADQSFLNLNEKREGLEENESVPAVDVEESVCIPLVPESTLTEPVDTSSNTKTVNSDSEDEIPLSTLLSSDSSIFDESNLGITAIEKEEENSYQILDIQENICPKLSEEVQEPQPVDEEEEKSEVKVEEREEMKAEEVKTEEQEEIKAEEAEVKTETVHPNKTKDVLMEINDNLCEQHEILNHVASPTSMESKPRKCEKNDSEITTQEVNTLITLERCSEKLNFLINNNIENVMRINKANFLNTSETVNADESLHIEENLSADDSSESKENSAALVEDSLIKNKSKKKQSTSNKFVNKNRESKESAVNRKSVRSAKARALESILDEALLELSENEFFENVNKKNDSIISEVKPTEDSKSNFQEENENESEIENAKELRRSRRNSKKITSYNEVDLVDPLLDDLDSDKTISKILKETTKDIFGIKRKNRKVSKKVIKNGQNERKFTGDELFDLLKATPSENNVLSKPTDSIFNSFDEISNDFNDDNFDVFEDILEKSMAVIEEDLSEQAVSSVEKFPLSNTSFQNCTDLKPKENKVKVTRKKPRRSKHKNKTENIEKPNLLSCTSDVENGSALESLDNDLNPKSNIYCQICNKYFSRVESLTKHKRTLTHISKLSELEAKEAALKAKSESEKTEIPEKNVNLFDILEESKLFSPPFSVSVNNSNLKLADIINDVLNKPLSKKEENSHSFSDIMMSNEGEIQPEVRRCKSLAERKSFESENYVKNLDYFEPEINNEAAGTILEKQITLLENIIENRSTLSYIDELSVSSTQSVNESSTKKNDSLNRKDDTHKQPLENSFLKPSQYEEISEDSNLRNYDEQKSRKVLNRDEELFLECCSLLKSSSEVSTYSKKSNNLRKELNNLESKRCGDWVENNQKETADFVECYSDNTRMRTPLGDGFSQDDSNSATISSHWDRNSSSNFSKRKNSKRDDKNLSFEEMFNNNRDKEVIFREEDELKSGRLSSSFEDLTNVLTGDTKLRNLENLDESSIKTPNEKGKKCSDYSIADGKKMLTKGAMKVFEGLKVSIPTEELNIDKILISGQSANTFTSSSDDLTNASNKKSCSLKSSKTKIKLSSLKKQNNMSMSSKIHDVYDFEETQDNSDIFTKPDFRSFRHNYEKSKKTDKGSDDDSQDFIDAVSFDAFSSSTSSVSEQLPVTSKTQQNITKKKCMIMGRIFKNAVKSKDIDEDIRNIPMLDNSKLVEDFVLSCPDPIERKVRMTEEERNLAFDSLLNSKYTGSNIDKNQSKNTVSKRKIKTKNKKRTHTGSESSDDEFKLQKSTKKRPKKKCNNVEESCINLEQELRECIGVASRKSQRKCTSGKQNVLMEYWSSDESSFEVTLERQIVESAQNNQEPIKETEPIVERIPDAPHIHKKIKVQTSTSNSNRRKRAAVNPLYHWSSSSEDERDLIVIRPVRDEIDDDEDRPVQHGWIVGDSPKKLVTMLAQAKGKKCEVDGVKEHGKKRTFS